MGQYFLWCNPDKMQYIDAVGFDLSIRENGYINIESKCTNAVYTLMKKEWKGDTVFFLGDYWWDSKRKFSALERFPKEFKENLWNHILDHGEDMAPYFRESVIDIESEMQEDQYDLQEGLITKVRDFSDPKYFRKEIDIVCYVIDHSKKEYFDRKKMYTDGREDSWFDPFPFLTVYAARYDNERYSTWLGDTIEVTDNRNYIRYLDRLEYYDMSDVYNYHYFCPLYR